jgi:hypothetical protein
MDEWFPAGEPRRTLVVKNRNHVWYPTRPSPEGGRRDWNERLFER